MKKFIALSLFVFLTLSCAPAFASLNDTQASIIAQYGDYRMVVDDYNQLWTRTEWEAGGNKKAKANSYIYQFRRNGLGFQMEVQYDGNKPDSLVKAQRITPDMGFKIKELREYLPEVYEVVVGPTAQAFSSDQSITTNFREKTSPVTLGILIKQTNKAGGPRFATIVAFSIMDEGRYIREAQYINQDTYIQEIVFERDKSSSATTAADREKGDPILVATKWSLIKNNPFIGK